MRNVSFIDLLRDQYFDIIYNELYIYIEDNPDILDCSTFNVENPDEACLDLLELHTVKIKQSSDKWLYFDIIGIAQIEISETIKRERETDYIEQWFNISCKAKFDVLLSDFSIEDKDVYSKYRLSKENNLSQFLIPIINKEQLDDIAEGFLKKYYPDALEKPVQIPVWEISKKMGLNIKEVNISKTCSVFGKIFFSDSITQYYDSEQNEFKELSVKRGTILVDPNVYFLRNLGCVNNTIIHECVHWELHKDFFDLQKIYNQELDAIDCLVEEPTKLQQNWTHYDWLEWQANSIAPRILMPKKQTQQKAEELIYQIKQLSPNLKKNDLMRTLIDELASFFGVSKLAAKIRLIDIGYKDAIGINAYIDDHYIQHYTFDHTSLKENQTFDISFSDALFEYATNVQFRNLLDTGKYIYVDNHFCINDPKYIKFDEHGYAQLTQYALSHLDECCLVFDIKVNWTYGIKHYQEKVLYRNAVSNTKIELKYVHNNQNDRVEKRAEEYIKIGQLAKEDAEVVSNLPSTFSGSLKSHMERIGMTIEQLAEKSLVGERTIQRMRNEDSYNPKLGTIVAVCVGLQLRPTLSMDLIQKAGYSFKMYLEEHIIYHFLINSHYLFSIYECNEILRANNCKPIGKED